MQIFSPGFDSCIIMLEGPVITIYVEFSTGHKYSLFYLGINIHSFITCMDAMLPILVDIPTGYKFLLF